MGGTEWASTILNMSFFVSFSGTYLEFFRLTIPVLVKRNEVRRQPAGRIVYYWDYRAHFFGGDNSDGGIVSKIILFQADPVASGLACFGKNTQAQQP